MVSWNEHCKSFSEKNKCTFKQAMSNKECRDAYHAGKEVKTPDQLLAERKERAKKKKEEKLVHSDPHVDCCDEAETKKKPPTRVRKVKEKEPEYIEAVPHHSAEVKEPKKKRVYKKRTPKVVENKEEDWF